MSASAQIVLSIEDLLVQILLHLPIESLIQFKSISKHWYSLITSPNFCHRRSRKPTPAVGLLLMPRCPPPRNGDDTYLFIPFSIQNPATAPFRRLNFIKDPSSAIELLQSCNGLFLCRTHWSDFKGHANPMEGRYYYVCNPTTKRFYTLPKVQEKCIISAMCLVYDPSESPHYKVVASFVKLIDDGTEICEMRIYSSEIGHWKKCGVRSTKGIHGAVYWNGALHLFEDIEKEEEEEDDDDEEEEEVQFVVFKVDEETYHIMPSPPHLNDLAWRRNDHLMVSGGHLHYMDMFTRQINFNIYEMKRDYSEWYVKYQVDLSSLVTDYPEMIPSHTDYPEMIQYHLDPSELNYSKVTLVRGEKDEDTFFVLLVPGKIIRYYLLENRHEMLYELDIGETGRRLRCKFMGLSGYEFIESLCVV